MHDAATPALIDRFVSDPQFRERHRSYIEASPSAVYDALKRIDFARSATIRVLFNLRGLGRRLGAGGRPLRIRWEDMLRIGFLQLAEQPGAELVIGIAAGPTPVTSADQFLALSGPGWVKIAMNWTVAPRGAGTIVATETRVSATDAASRRRFALYWLAIRPFSGLIRRRMLAVLRADVRTAGESP